MRRRLAAGNIFSPAPILGNSPLQQFSALAPLPSWLGNDGVGPLGRGNIRAGSSGSSSGCQGDPSDAARVHTAQRRSKRRRRREEQKAGKGRGGGRTNKQTDREAGSHTSLPALLREAADRRSRSDWGVGEAVSHEDTPLSAPLLLKKMKPSFK